MLSLRFFTIGLLSLPMSFVFGQTTCEEHQESQIGCVRYEEVSNYSAREKVMILPRIPLAEFDTESQEKIDDDVKDELHLFNINFNRENVALCPKLKSTSPGTYILHSGGYTHDVNGAMMDINQAFAEQFFCPGKVEASILATEIKRLRSKRDKANQEKKESLVQSYQASIDAKNIELNKILEIISLHELNGEGSYVRLPLVEQKLEKLAKFKVTMNDKDTSGTYAPSNLLYYQFSRFLKTRVGVPVSIYREIQAKHHLERVAIYGEKWAEEYKDRVSATYRQLYNGWRRLKAAEDNPNHYFIGKKSIVKDIYSSENEENIWGILIKDKGDRYLHRTRKSTTDVTQSINGLKPSPDGYNERQQEFIKSKPFLALRGELDWTKLTSPLEKVQYQFWMQELAEIVILDFIFSQQDRVGNIDYRDYVYYYEGQLQVGEESDLNSSADSHFKIGRKKLSKWKKFQKKSDNLQVIGKLRRSFINDNDAGARLAYTNYSKKHNLPGLIRHLDHRFLSRLIYLNNALKNEKSLQYRYFYDNYVVPRLITKREFEQFGKNLNMMLFGDKKITTNLSDTCKEIAFDLDPEKLLNSLIEKGSLDSATETKVKVNCERLFAGQSDYLE